jgi:hypothetical protein
LLHNEDPFMRTLLDCSDVENKHDLVDCMRGSWQEVVDLQGSNLRVIVNLYRKEEKTNVGELVLRGEDFNFEMWVGGSEAGWDRNVRVEGFPIYRALVVDVEVGGGG